MVAHRSNSLGAPEPGKSATVETRLDKEAVNVATEAGFRELIETGYHIQVICEEDAYRKNSVWHGLWALRAFNDKGAEKQLVTARARQGGDRIKVRTFKTVTGLVSFLVDLGFEVVAFPVFKGQSWTYVAAQAEHADDG